MKLWILSDLHQEFDEFAWQPSSIPNHDVLVLAGDIHVPGRAAIEFAARLTDKPIILIAGNHEFYGQEVSSMLNETKQIAEEYNHVHFLDNDTVTVGDVKFIGSTLWTDLRLNSSLPLAKIARTIRKGMNDYRKIKVLRSDGARRKRIDPRHTLEMHRTARNFIEAELAVQAPNLPMKQKQVVVSHHAPTILGCPESFHRDPLLGAYASDLTSLIMKYQPDLWIHGHTHHCHETSIGATRVISNARGYLDNSGLPFDDRFLAEI